MDIVLERAEKNLCPLCCKPIDEKYTVMPYDVNGERKMVMICNHHPHPTDE